MNLRIAHQDRRVVQTQVPKRSQINGEEKLIQGDLPIIEYRKKRQELLDAVNDRCGIRYLNERSSPGDCAGR